MAKPSLSLGELASATPSRRTLPWILVLFAGSGCAALILEIVWLQMLQLLIGLTAVSLGLLLASFMGGLCLGSLLLPKCVPALIHPLRVYACLELGIGVIGLAVLLGVPQLAHLYSGTGISGIGGVIFRGAIAAVCLLPPTLLMGATLPALSRWVQTTKEGVSWLGFFYGGNIVGAVAGCLLAGFYLLRVYDMATATYVAVSLNGALTLAALALAARSPYDAGEARAKPARRPLHAAGEARIIYVAIALSGLTALGAEVLWTRLLALILGGTVYTFSIILAVMLAGLGMGAAIGGFTARSSTLPRLALWVCQTLLVLTSAWAAYMIARSLPHWPVNPALSLSPWYTFQLDLARCLWVVLPGSILWGASFPLAIACLAETEVDPAPLVARVYAANTVGAIVGALSFTLVLIPAWGTKVAEQALVLTSAASAVLLASSAPSGGASERPGGLSFSLARAMPAIGMGMFLMITAGLVWITPTLPWGVIAYGRFMATYGNRLVPGIIKEDRVPSNGGSETYCTYMGEGLNGSVVVTKTAAGVRSFHSAGKVQASTDAIDMRLQRLLGHLSALAHPKPESVLVVACGAGVTAGTFVTHPDVKRIVICDIEPLVPKNVAPLFEIENHAVLKDSRTQVVTDDGRHFIRTTKEKFDIITSDPIDPWVKGCAALNTIDYYELCKAHLKPGGVMSLWVPLYESNPEAVRSMIATFFRAFPNAVLWGNDREGEGYDAVLLGQLGPTQIDLDQLQLRLNRPDHARVKKSMAQVGFYTAVDLLATYAGEAQELQGWAQGAQINTDRNLRLQYLAGLGFNSFVSAELRADIHRYYRFPDKLFVGSAARVQMLKYALEGESK